MKLLREEFGKVSGTVMVERSMKNRQGTVIAHENATTVLPPFSREEVHARVGGSVSSTLARNYHSVSVMVSINIPVHATKRSIDQGLAWCFERANIELNTQLEGANIALNKMSTRHDG
jgi:hypothetical protein